MNHFKTFILLFGLTVLFMAIGNLIGGQQGMVMAFVFALLMNAVSYWFSDKIVLALYGAKATDESEHPEIYKALKRLTAQAGIPMPKVYIIPKETPNAFATGRNPNHAAVAVTTGIMNLLTEEELSGVLAHELAHVRNRDILISTIAATIAGAIMMLADMARWAAIFGGHGHDDRDRGASSAVPMLIVAVLAPIAAFLIQAAISRSREFEADATGAKISGNPLSLANALRKLAAGVQRNPLKANPATAHMFIVNPFSGQKVLSLFSTHPPTEARVERLEQMAGTTKTYGTGINIPKIVY